MGGRLTSYVYVQDDAGETHGFGPGDIVPDWAAAKIVNPDVWDGDPPTTAVPEQEAEPDAGDGRPPLGGPGSGKDVWAAFAQEHGIEVPDDASRDDIVALVDDAGL